MRAKDPLQRTPDSEGLPPIAGLDIRDGLLRVGGNRGLYLKLLRQFVEQQGPAVEEITAALGKGDTAVAERLAHSLKGVAGNLGARQVQSTAGALEKLIHDRAGAKDIEAGSERVAEVLEPLVAQLRDALTSAGSADPAQPRATAPVDPVRSREAGARLIALLSDLDPGAGEFIEANDAALRPLFSDGAWPAFAKLVQDYAFADAQAQLEQALRSSPERSV